MPGSVRGSVESRRNQTQSLPVRIHSLWGRKVSQQTLTGFSGRSFWVPLDAEPNSSTMGAELDTLMLGLGVSIKVCQWKEVLIRPVKAWPCERSLPDVRRTGQHQKDTCGLDCFRFSVLGRGPSIVIWQRNLILRVTLVKISGGSEEAQLRQGRGSGGLGQFT